MKWYNVPIVFTRGHFMNNRDQDDDNVEIFSSPNFETRFINVLNKTNDEQYMVLLNLCGETSIINNGLSPRTKHEIFSGLKVVDRIGVEIDAKIFNLPFTVSNGRKLADTAFTFRKIELRNIYLVPDHTITRVMKEKDVSLNIIEDLLQKERISSTIAEKWCATIANLDVGERVAGSILHEYGHILTYRAMDRAGIGNSVTEGYGWLVESGYLANCLRRIVGFSLMNPLVKINYAMEQMAEDYRISHYVKCHATACCLTHGISFAQDISKPELYLEGVSIMTQLISVKKTHKKVVSTPEKKTLIDVLPFGELNRSDVLVKTLAGGSIPSMSDAKIKQLIDKDMEWLKNYAQES
jgi:hypothetical protein